MILSRPEIQDEIDKKRIRFDPPIDENQIGPDSVDLRLGHTFTSWKAGLTGLTVSTSVPLPQGVELYDTRTLVDRDSLGKRETIKIAPAEFLLAMTYESVYIPPDLVAMVEGRSTYARFGLTMHQTAPWIHAGFEGPITLEIRNSGPLTLELTPIDDRPCQLTFMRLTSPLPDSMVYGSGPADIYQRQKHPLKR